MATQNETTKKPLKREKLDDLTGGEVIKEAEAGATGTDQSSDAGDKSTEGATGTSAPVVTAEAGALGEGLTDAERVAEQFRAAAFAKAGGEAPPVEGPLPPNDPQKPGWAPQQPELPVASAAEPMLGKDGLTDEEREINRRARATSETLAHQAAMGQMAPIVADEAWERIHKDGKVDLGEPCRVFFPEATNLTLDPPYQTVRVHFKQGLNVVPSLYAGNSYGVGMHWFLKGRKARRVS